MNKIDIFNYHPSNNLIFRINPLIKLFTLIFICVITGIFNSYLLSIPIAFIIFLLLTSGAYVRKQFLSLWKIYIFLIFTGIIKVLTSSSIAEGLLFFFQLLVMTIAGLLFYSTTRLSQLRPVLSRIIGKKAADIFIMMMSFLPLIFITVEENREARYSRSFKAGAKPFRSLKFTALPLLIDMLTKTDDMADAWYSRGYFPGKKIR